MGSTKSQTSNTTTMFRSLLIAGFCLLLNQVCADKSIIACCKSEYKHGGSSTVGDIAGSCKTSYSCVTNTIKYAANGTTHKGKTWVVTGCRDDGKFKDFNEAQWAATTVPNDCKDMDEGTYGEIFKVVYPGETLDKGRVHLL